MFIKFFSRRVLFVIFLGGLAIFVTIPIVVKSLRDGSVLKRTNSIETQKEHRMPIRLRIPKIHLDTSIEYVGLTGDGSMDVPKNIDNVAWYKFGPKPGEKGSAVIAGHYGVIKGKIPAFEELGTLREGDKIHVLDDRGTTLSFVVRAIKRYQHDADATDIFRSNDGKSHLNLITCEGAWDATIRTYPERLIIFTDQEKN